MKYTLYVFDEPCYQNRMLRWFMLLASVVILSSCATNPTVSYNSEGLKTAIDEHREWFSVCYHEAKRGNSSLNGKILIQWDVKADGRAVNGLVRENTTGDSKLATCILSIILNLKFPKPPKDEFERVVYPFIFTKN